MAETMELWNAVCRPPESALKEIKGGRLSGMTDIKPQWRLQIMTEQFGPCGTGWGYEIDKVWTEPGSDGQVFALVLVHVWYKGMEQTTPGLGGAMLVDKEKAGLHCDDDAFKKALTDALGVAFRALGVAADVYLGKAVGAKYKQPTPAEADGSAMLAKLFHVLRGALNGKTLNPNQLADTVKGLDRFLSKHPDKNVSDYTKAVEDKLAKVAKGESDTPAQPSEDKGKAELLGTIANMPDKQAAAEGGQEEIF